MNINAHFQLKGAMEFPFVATKMGFFLHNSRGLNSLVATGIQYDDGSAAALTGAFANVTIGKADVDGDGVADGLRFDVNRFEGDMDMTNITLGDAPTIGSLYITDMKCLLTWLFTVTKIVCRSLGSGSGYREETRSTGFFCLKACRAVRSEQNPETMR